MYTRLALYRYISISSQRVILQTVCVWLYRQDDKGSPTLHEPRVESDCLCKSHFAASGVREGPKQTLDSSEQLSKTDRREEPPATPSPDS